jgi:hypothetical protein
MALDFTRISPAALVRLLNSTRLGRCLTERQLYRHRMEAGLRIGDERHIHLLRYASWLAARLAAKERSFGNRMVNDKQLQYKRHKKRAAQRQAEIAEEGQEIGPPPAVVNPKRREACRLNFRLFCETYFKPVFYLEWSPDHLRALAKIERAVLQGELFAFAMPRGSGKSELCRAAVVWAALTGACRYVCLIAATDRMARKILRKIYNALERNDLLMEDFPEVCHPVKKLERTPQRAMKQRCQGEYTMMVWTHAEIVLPAVKVQGQWSAASGTIISVCGITGGEIRGQSKDMPDGTVLRPSLVLLDDPQTKGSAKSPTQCQDRVELLQGDILGLAGPDRTIAGMMPCTVIRPGDMADEILDQEKHPEWHGERTKLVYAWPDAEALWEEYANRRATGLRRGDPSAATEFYRSHRSAMDAGAVLAWPERFTSDCLSALQYAMNLKLRDEAMFAAEYQNEPLTAKEELDCLTAEEIAAKCNRRPEGAVPASCGRLVMYVDVQKKCLYYAVVALEANFTAYLVEYGAWPDQQRHYFAYREVRRTLATAHRGHGEEAAIYAGLQSLVEEKLGRPWPRDDGAEMRISLCLIDSGYQKDTVELYVRQSKYAATVMSAKGFGVGASSVPLEERTKKKGEEVGDGWKITGSQGEHAVRLLLIDTNHWKSFLHARLAVPLGDAGCLSLWGKSEQRHRMISEHFTSEYRVRTEGRGRKVDEWKETPGYDNHLFDCAVGCMAAASMVGCRLLGKLLPAKKPKKPVKKRKAKYL